VQDTERTDGEYFKMCKILRELMENILNCARY